MTPPPVTDAGDGDARAPVLTAVMPTYNEATGIRETLSAWLRELARLGVPYELRVYDDGSRDGTGDAVAALAREAPSLVLVRQENRGHGPTVLRGYREARGEWVFQTDSDDEMGPEFLPAVWAARERADLVLGYRDDRKSPVGRRVISTVARWSVRLLFGGRLRDVNAPYRLHRRSALAALLPRVPADTFAPNVILAGLFARAGYRIVEVPVSYRTRRTGQSSIVRWKLWRAAARSLLQTVRVAARR